MNVCVYIYIYCIMYILRVCVYIYIYIYMHLYKGPCLRDVSARRVRRARLGSRAVRQLYYTALYYFYIWRNIMYHVVTYYTSLIQHFLVMCVMVPRGKMEVSCLSRVVMGPASSFPLGAQTSRTSPGYFFQAITHIISYKHTTSSYNIHSHPINIQHITPYHIHSHPIT